MKPAPQAAYQLPDPPAIRAGEGVRVVAPSRLHFGMFSFGCPEVRQFGGVGAMIDAPGLELVIDPDAALSIEGPLREEIGNTCRRVLDAECLHAEPRCRIRLTRAPSRHVGLGSGTQLALAVAAGMRMFLGLPHLPSEALARAAGRGRRSAIGLYGFQQGGLLIEAGKLASDEISPLADRVDLPEDWRFVLLCPRGEAGLSGDAERRAFEHLPPVPPERTEKLLRTAHEVLLPAAQAGDFASFSAALYEFNHEAGLCFAVEQDGAYASPRVRSIVDHVRALGVTGVAQTSWGPTVAAVLENVGDAERLAEDMREGDLEVTIAAPNNRGATYHSSRPPSITTTEPVM